LVDAACPICGKVYSIPEGRGREMVVTKFLAHKDVCQLPDEDGTKWYIGIVFQHGWIAG